LKYSNEQSLKEVINELIKTYKLENGIAEANIISSWERIVGTMIFKHTEKIYIKNRNLYLKIDSPALKHELSMVKSILLKKINKSVNQGQIKEIIFI
jgi:predicted nucleic acid-binding Zn ribbon protein